MSEIDKAAFGRFVALRRRAAGLTQKQLARRVMVSDKAVSKWETGASLPDIQLLAPLAEVLGVTVAELLACQPLAGATGQTPSAGQPGTCAGQRGVATEQAGAPAGQADGGRPSIPGGQRLADQAIGQALPPVEELVQRALYYGSGGRYTHRPTAAERRRWALWYFAALALGVLGTLALLRAGRLDAATGSNGATLLLLAAVFGAYFGFWAPGRLPDYYDEHFIDIFTDGPLRVHITGLALNNCRWPHMLRACRLWALAVLAGTPALQLLLSLLPAPLAPWVGLAATLAVALGGLFLPFVLIARRHPLSDPPQD